MAVGVGQADGDPRLLAGEGPMDVQVQVGAAEVTCAGLQPTGEGGAGLLGHRSLLGDVAGPRGPTGPLYQGTSRVSLPRLKAGAGSGTGSWPQGSRCAWVCGGGPADSSASPPALPAAGTAPGPAGAVVPRDAGAGAGVAGELLFDGFDEGTTPRGQGGGEVGKRLVRRVQLVPLGVLAEHGAVAGQVAEIGGDGAQLVA